MHILLTSPTFPPFNSGLGNAVNRQALAFVSHGHNVVVATTGNQRHTRLDPTQQFTIEEFPLSGAIAYLNPIKGNPQSYIDFLKSSQFDHIFFHAWQNWATDLALQEIDHISGQKYLFSHCISTNIFFKHQPVRSLIRYLLWRPYWWKLPSHFKKLDGVIFLSNGGSDSRFDDLKLAKKHQVPLHVIPNCLSQEANAELTEPTHDFSKRSQLISVGSYDWQKGFDFVLRAYAQSKAKNIIPLKFFGQTNSPFRESLIKLSQQLDINQDHVEFCTGVSGNDLIIEYRKSYAFLSGSHTECQPLVLLDANATGTPFIARSTGCINRMSGGYAIETIAEMASHINKIISDNSLWQKLSSSGRDDANHTYKPDITITKLLEIINPVKSQ